MTLHTFINELKRLLPESSWPWVISSLREDPIIWECLDGDLGEKVIKRGSLAPEDYSPATIALTALDIDTEPYKLRQEPMVKVDTDIQITDSTSPILSQLANQGLAALKARESRRLTGLYQNLYDDLDPLSPTALACLYAIVPDPFELLSGLMISNHPDPVDQDTAFSLSLHVILANPLPPHTQASIIRNLLSDLPISRKITFLKLTHAKRPRLASHLALSIAKEELTPDNGTASIFDRLEYQYWVAQVWRIADDPQEEVRILAETVKGARQLQAELTAQLAGAASNNDDPQNALIAWEQALDLEPGIPHRAGDYILTLIDNHRHAEARQRLETYQTSPAHPKLLLARALLDHSDGDLHSAKENAYKALSLINPGADQDQNIQRGQSKPAKGSTGCISDLIRLTRLLIQLNAPYEAVQAVQQVMKDRLMNVDHLELAAKTFRYAGDTQKAVQAAHLALALAPERSELRQQLIHALEAAGDWPEALRERKLLLDQVDPSSLTDRIAYATCSLKAGYAQPAKEICEEILEEEPESGLAYAILGEACFALGEAQYAFDHLERAVQLDPNQPPPWISLAQTQLQSGLPEKALESLKAGVQTSPHQPELHLAMGELHLAQDSPTLALNAFKKAAELIGLEPWGMASEDIENIRPEENSGRGQEHDRFAEHSMRIRQRDAKIALRLGQTLQQLGHPENAYQVLEYAYSHYPYDATIAYAYAKVLVALDQFSSALSPLEIVLQTSPNHPDPYLDYAACLLSLHTKVPSPERSKPSMKRALNAIHAALEIDPECAQAKAYLAEALASDGHFQEALEAYRQALETDLSSDPIWFSRLSLGLGRVALELNYIETAIAALQEANQTDPAKVEVKRSLAEAYQAADLHQEGYQMAQAALHQAPDDMETLIWFADHILSLDDRLEKASANAESEAIEVLQRALQIDPYRTDLAARLGHIYLKTGQNEAAKETFQGLISEDMDDPVTGYRSTARDAITDLHRAARGLLQLGEANSAVACLQRALQTKPHDLQDGGVETAGSSTSLFTLLSDLSLAHLFSGDFKASLQTLDQSIPLADVKTPLYITKADIYLHQEEYFDALETLGVALQVDPENPDLLYRLAFIQRAAGNIGEAFQHANAALPLIKPMGAPGGGADILTLAAELHQALLKDDTAHQILNDSRDDLVEWAHQILKKVEPEFEETSPGIFDYFCAHAEMSIFRGEFENAIQDLGILLELSPDTPRVTAIQARLAAHRFDPDGNLYAEAERLLDTALERLAENQKQNINQQGPTERTPITGLEPISHPQSPAFSRLRDKSRSLSSTQAVAEAALDLNRWSTSAELFEKVSQSCPTEPRAHLSRARALVVTAEYQRTCMELEAVRHAPGESALDDSEYKKFKEAIENAETFLKNSFDEADLMDDSETGLDPAQLAIQRWHARGEAIFHPSFQNAERLSKFSMTPSDSAAHITCLRLIGDNESATLAANTCSHHPLVLAQLAMTQLSENPRQSLAAAHAAVETLSEDLKQDPQDLVDLGSRNLALIHALAARLVHRLGNRSSDQSTSLSAIRIALGIWPDEPRWHYLAAQIHLKSQDHESSSERLAAIAHLEEACSLEPHNPKHPLELGRIFMLEDNPEQAVLHLEKATELDAEMAAAWFNLARAQRMAGELDQALLSAEKAISLSPDEISPLLLRGEIALLAENPNRAIEFVEKALSLNAEDPSVLLLKARSLSQIDQPEGALEAIETALPYADDPLPLFLERIRLIRRAQGRDAALEAVQGLAEAYPEEPRVLACLARNLEGAGREEEAIRTIQRAIRAEGISSPIPATDRSEMHHLLGRLLKNAGQLDQAIHHLTEAIRLNAKQVEPYLELGQVHQERRQHAQALKAYEQAIAARPEDHRAYFEAGVALKENKDYLGAERMLRKAAKLAPNDLSVHRMLGAVVALNLIHNRRKSSINV